MNTRDGDTAASTPEGTDSGQFFRAIADVLPGMVAYWDKDMRCRFANRPYRDWFGKPAEAIIGTTLRDLLGERLFSLDQSHIDGGLGWRKKQRFEAHADPRPTGASAILWPTTSPTLTAMAQLPDSSSWSANVTRLKRAEGRAQAEREAAPPSGREHDRLDSPGRSPAAGSSMPLQHAVLSSGGDPEEMLRISRKDAIHPEDIANRGGNAPHPGGGEPVTCVYRIAPQGTAATSGSRALREPCP